MNHLYLYILKLFTIPLIPWKEDPDHLTGLWFLFQFVSSEFAAVLATYSWMMSDWNEMFWKFRKFKCSFSKWVLMKGERGCDPSWQTISRKLMETFCLHQTNSEASVWIILLFPTTRCLMRKWRFLSKPAFHLSLYCKCFKRENLFKTFTTNSVKKVNKIFKYKVFYN